MRVSRLAFVLLCAALVCVAGAAVAQTVVDTQVKSGTVIGKTDHSVIVKMDDGVVREIEVPPGRTAMVDGKEVGLADLQIGTTLAATFHTVTKPVEVKTTTIKDGQVVRVAGSTLTTKEKDGLHTYTIPKGFRFQVDGREVGVNELSPGMKLNATIVTTSTTMTTETQRAGAAVGKAPPTPAPVAAAPAPAPEPVAAPAPAPAPVAAAEPAKKLPKTAGPLPLLALLGVASLAAGAGLRAYRSR
jgi:phage gp45-like